MDGTAPASHAGMKAGGRHDARYAMAEGGTGAAGPHAAAQRRRDRVPADGPRPAEPAAEPRLAELRHQTAELNVHIDSLTHAFERTFDENVREHLGYLIRRKSRHLADLEDETAELERLARGARGPLRRMRAQPAAPIAQPAAGWEAAPGHQMRETAAGWYPGAAPGDRGPMGDAAPAFVPPGSAPAPPGDGPGDQVPSPRERTGDLVSHGRRSACRPRLSRGRKGAIGAAAAAVLTAIVATVLAGGSASWPASVATVQSEAASACQNPNVASEPDQVNFACAKATRQILWVFALMTSGDNPHFTDAKTGRVGLEPITPTLGGEVAWSLNLHHPYNPDNPADSLEVAARAINDIIGGATLTGSGGQPVVQPGLESYPVNCVRYTGSAAVSSHQGFPGRCASPVTVPGGQAALVADVFSKWIAGSAPWAAQDAAVLFENAGNPGDPQVQAILRKLRSSKPLA